MSSEVGKCASTKPRSTARGGRALVGNNLDGTLPAELGKLTDLEALCAAAAQPLADRSAPRACAALVCSGCGNKLSGTIGGWIGGEASGVADEWVRPIRTQRGRRRAETRGHAARQPAPRAAERQPRR
jgi:hypothetical protein